MNVCVIGIGHVGLVAGAGLAELGNRVICVDTDKKKLANLQAGGMPFYEHGLEELVIENQKAERLFFTADIAEGVHPSDVIIIAVNTPENESGEADISQITRVSEDLAQAMNKYKIIVIKSTVPIGTLALVTETFQNRGKMEGVDFDIVAIPEFLREGNAVYDFFHPSRIIIGTDNSKARDTLDRLFSSLNAPIIHTKPVTAQMIKYASNAFLSSRISFINEIANICEEVGADVANVTHGMSYDKRFGEGYLNPGIGFGGPCLVKDLKALIKMAESHGYEANYLKSILEKNESQIRVLVHKVKEALGGSLYEKTIGVLGLAFKEGTSDVRNSLSIKIIEHLKMEGANIKAYDPQGMEEARKIISNISLVQDPYQAAEADALVILTAWQEFKSLNLKKLRGSLKKPIVIDGVNVLDPQEMKELGFIYQGVGRGS